MAITVRQQITALSAGSTTALPTMTLPSNTVAGNLLVMFMAGDKNTGSVLSETWRTSDGWSAIWTDMLSTSVSLYGYARTTAGGTDNAVTVTWPTTSTSGNTGILLELEGDSGTWDYSEVATAITDEVATGTWESGSILSADSQFFLGAFGVDSTTGITGWSMTDAFTDPYTQLYGSPASGRAGLYVGSIATGAISIQNATLGVTGFTDQISGACVGFRRTAGGGGSSSGPGTKGQFDPELEVMGWF